MDLSHTLVNSLFSTLMLVRQSKNTFIRVYDKVGYITNQLTRYDRSYNETGADFLSKISREPQEIENIIFELHNLYGDSVALDKLKYDFEKFVIDLEEHYFLVTGESIEECDKKDIEFSYSLGNMKTKIYDFTQSTEQNLSISTEDYMLALDQKKPQLKSIQFELTSRCNERCIHCYIPNSKKDMGNDMSYEQVCNIIDQFASIGGLHVTLSGGEVFLHKDIIRIIQYCRKKDMEICILSNLISLKDVQIPFVKAANVSYVQASLYSMIPEIHDSITTIKGSHIKTKSAIEKLVAADIPVQISCPLMKANKDGYSDVLKYAQSLQIKAFSDYIMMARADLSTNNLMHRLSIGETEKVLRDIMDFDPDYSKWIEKKRPKLESLTLEELATQPLCGVGLNNFCISENGDVYPCPGWQSLVVGNVNNQTLKEIWEQSDELKALRNVSRRDFPECLNCEARRYCSMCLERNFNENDGNMFKVNKHFCEVAFLTKKIHEEYRNKGLI